jgi:hypothetical protein
MQLFLHQVYVLTVAELRELLWRRRSLLSLLLYSLIILLSAWLLFKVHGTMGSEHAVVDLRSPDHADLAAMLDKLGARETFEIFSLVWFPTFVGLVSCDSIALDVYRGTLRFVLLRSSRLAYYFSKLISHVILYVVLQFLSLVAVVFYSASAIEGFDTQEAIKLALKYFIVFIPFLWCVVAATQWISSWSRRPMNALIRVHVMWVAFMFIVAFVPWASPLWSKIGMGLFVPFDNYPGLTFIGYSAWGLFFTILGVLFFVRRDV